MRVLLICLTMLVLQAPVVQADDTISLLQLRNLTVDFQLLVTKNQEVEIKDILSPAWQKKFKKPSEVEEVSPAVFYWMKIDFANKDLSAISEWILFLGYFDEIILYYQEDGAIKTRKAGTLVPDTDSIGSHQEGITFASKSLFEGKYLYARIRHVREFKSPSDAIVYYSAKPALAIYDKLYTWDYFKYYIPVYLFVGGIAVMVFYSCGIYFLYRDKVILQYSAFLFLLLLYLGRKAVLVDFMAEYPQFNYIFNEVVQIVVNITYLYFVLTFLNAKKEYPKLYKISTYVIYLLIALIAVELTILSQDIFSPIQIYLINFEHIFMYIFALSGITYVLFNLKNKVALFIILGTICFTTSTLLTLLLVDLRYMLGGSIIETFIFSLGLGYRFRTMRREKTRIEQEINKIRLTALRAQMNPHFIFNSLNSIRSYIIKNETTKASEYLTKFSKLIRLILQYSSEDYISLQNEIEALKLYVELEQMRFRESFGFTITIGTGLDPERVKIPPLILQPYIENAVWHGLTPKAGIKKLELILETDNLSILCTIRDNGVGRTFSKNKIRDPFKKPMAMELTSSRINLIRSNQAGENNICIEDIVEEGKPMGTEVKLMLPLIYDPA